MDEGVERTQEKEGEREREREREYDEKFKFTLNGAKCFVALVNY